ncbi:hypothetical protein [Brevibacillus dissolubilis]|uniref:hypothetical protein n=1 Tax=Brevibacillus dissolubilis TaxID=1844116 RepID=UPI001116C818|nr:hypothetical protein [Brevibacillus dissolubilis]
MTKHYAAHELLEVNELLQFKNVCLTKSTTMQAFTTDPVLKGLMQQDVQTTQQQIRDLQGIITARI